MTYTFKSRKYDLTCTVASIIQKAKQRNSHRIFLICLISINFLTILIPAAKISNFHYHLVPIFLGSFLLTSIEFLILFSIGLGLELGCFFIIDNTLVGEHCLFDFIMFALIGAYCLYVTIQMDENIYQEKILFEKNERLEVNHLQGLHIAALAHEIRQPLCALLLNSKLIIEKETIWNLNHESKRLMESVHEQIEELSRIVQTLESLASSNKSSFSIVNLGILVKNIIDKKEPLFRQQSIKVQLDIDHLTCMLEADSYQLHILLKNIIDNAVVSVSKKPIQDRIIAISIKSTVKDLYLSIADSGLGFINHSMSRNFHFCYQSNGMGVGLSLINSLIASNQAEILYGRSQELGGALIEIKFRKVLSQNKTNKESDRVLLDGPIVNR